LTALLAATSASHAEVVRLLLERGANINSVDQVDLP
jgi:ankyrin repeat protein